MGCADASRLLSLSAAAYGPKDDPGRVRAAGATKEVYVIVNVTHLQ
jgi:hypothetical protein